MRSIPASSSATRATTATAFATTWRSEASNPSSRRDRTVRRQSNTIGKPTSGATSSSDASIASSNSGASPLDTRKPPELTFRCYASQQRNSGSKPSTRPSPRIAPGGGCTGQFTHETAQADRGARLGPRDDGTSNLENPRRRAAEDHVALLGREPQRLDDLDRALIAHVEAIVAAGHHPVDAHLRDHEFQDRLRMRDGVVGEAAQIAARRLGEVLGFLAHLPAIVDAADQDRQRAARAAG